MRGRVLLQLRVAYAGCVCTCRVWLYRASGRGCGTRGRASGWLRARLGCGLPPARCFDPGSESSARY